MEEKFISYEQLQKDMKEMFKQRRTRKGKEVVIKPDKTVVVQKFKEPKKKEN